MSDEYLTRHACIRAVLGLERSGPLPIRKNRRARDAIKIFSRMTHRKTTGQTLIVEDQKYPVVSDPTIELPGVRTRISYEAPDQPPTVYYHLRDFVTWVCRELPEIQVFEKLIQDLVETSEADLSESAQAFRDGCVILPALEREKAELEKATPETVKDQKYKRERLAEIIEQIGKLKSGATIDRHKNIKDDLIEEPQPIGRREQQIEAIMAEIKSLEYNPEAIPRGGKGKIMRRCLNNTNLFTRSGFNHAWKEAKCRQLIEVDDPDQYRPSAHFDGNGH